MEYNIRFDLPEELDVLMDMDAKRRKYLNEKISEFLKGLLAQELCNGMDHLMLQVRPEINREETPPQED